jgi:hypothetical protein
VADLAEQALRIGLPILHAHTYHLHPVDHDPGDQRGAGHLAARRGAAGRPPGTRRARLLPGRARLPRRGSGSDRAHPAAHDRRPARHPLRPDAAHRARPDPAARRGTRPQQPLPAAGRPARGATTSSCGRPVASANAALPCSPAAGAPCDASPPALAESATTPKPHSSSPTSNNCSYALLVEITSSLKTSPRAEVHLPVGSASHPAHRELHHPLERGRRTNHLDRDTRRDHQQSRRLWTRTGMSSKQHSSLEHLPAK